MNERPLCDSCPLHEVNLDAKFVGYGWITMSLKSEVVGNVLGRSWRAEAACEPEPHPEATALAKCFKRFLDKDCPPAARPEQ